MQDRRWRRLILARPYGVSNGAPHASLLVQDAALVSHFEAHAWRTRFALKPVAASKKREKRGTDFSVTFCFIPSVTSTGLFVDLERVEPPAPIAEAEWRQGAFDMGAGSVASILFARCSVTEVMSPGGEVTKE